MKNVIRKNIKVFPSKLFKFQIKEEKLGKMKIRKRKKFFLFSQEKEKQLLYKNFFLVSRKKSSQFFLFPLREKGGVRYIIFLRGFATPKYYITHLGWPINMTGVG